MGWLFAGGFAAFAMRAVFWVGVWFVIGDGIHWALRILLAWIVGDLIATIVLKVFQKKD